MKALEQAIPVLIIIGPVGIGKSSTADAISELLGDEYTIPHAVVDLDDVRRAYPAPREDGFHMELGFINLGSIWKNYQAVGAKCLLIPSVMEKQEHFDKVRMSVPGADLFVVRLRASLEVNHARIRGREKTIESLNWHIQRSTFLAKDLEERKLENAIVDTDDKQPYDIAREIITKWGIIEWFGSITP